MADESLAQFCLTYGPQGEWVQLFAQSTGYVKTELHRDLTNHHRFITIDYWVSKEAYKQFRKRFMQEYAALDEVCATFTAEERFIGEFELAIRS